MTTTLSTAPASVNLSVRQGDTFVQKVVLREKDDEGAETPLDLTDWTAKMQVRARRSGDVMASLTEGAGIAITPEEGRIDLRIESAATAALACAEYSYDLQIVNPGDGDFQRTVIAGTFAVTPQVTT